ncbi:tRNA 2-thiocytidine biosynthesis TtcA family protein [Mycoplasma sp. P36-A1]|uniref:tRNA 2-thiocytidine biosynthesis TtcA family protein n=1 Tax=Mycoplasma sp. P36-A1 TaxID=3252900 RepID=UPI003C2AF267
MEEKVSLKEIERSIIKKYRGKLWAPFVKAINEFDMIQDGDKIAVCVSGGKDSMLLAKLFQELQKHGKKKFDLEFIAMDPGFSEFDKAMMIENCKHLNIPIHLFETNIFAVIEKKAADFPCYLCARMRRGHLYGFAQELGCNKIALGHHFNDVIETTMMNVLYAGNFKTMMPKLKSTNHDGMELLRPMVYVREKDIINYTKQTSLSPMNCGCVVAAGKTASTRAHIKQFIKDYKDIFDDVDKSIFAAGTNVNMDTIIGYVKDGEKYSFLDEY